MRDNENYNRIGNFDYLTGEIIIINIGGNRKYFLPSQITANFRSYENSIILSSQCLQEKKKKILKYIFCGIDIIHKQQKQKYNVNSLMSRRASF